LKKLIDEGKEYLFVSNIDNLAATVNFGKYMCYYNSTWAQI